MIGASGHLIDVSDTMFIVITSSCMPCDFHFVVALQTPQILHALAKC